MTSLIPGVEKSIPFPAECATTENVRPVAEMEKYTAEHLEKRTAIVLLVIPIGVSVNIAGAMAGLTNSHKERGHSISSA